MTEEQMDANSIEKRVEEAVSDVHTERDRALEEKEASSERADRIERAAISERWKGGDDRVGTEKPV
jgi:hypothetical protein